jgi:hypothetical protein
MSYNLGKTGYDPVPLKVPPQNLNKNFHIKIWHILIVWYSLRLNIFTKTENNDTELKYSLEPSEIDLGFYDSFTVSCS